MNIVKIALNVYKRLFKDITAIAFIIVFPMVAAIMAHTMLSSSVQKIGITNPDKDVLGLTEFLKNTQKYEVSIISEDDTIKNIDNNKKLAILTIKDNFNIKSQGNQEYVTVICKAANQNVAELNSIIEQYTAARITGNIISTSDIKTGESPQQKPLAAIGIFSMFMLVFSGVAMALLLEDKQKKTFMRIFSSPIKEHEFVAGNLIAFSLLGMVQICVFIFFSIVILKMDFYMNVFALFLILFLFFISAIGLAISIAALIKDYGKYNLVISLISIVTSFLSGAFFPIDSLNKVIIRLSDFLPQKWLLKAFKAFITGSGFKDALIPMIVLLLFALVFFVLGTKVLKPSAEDL